MERPHQLLSLGSPQVGECEALDGVGGTITMSVSSAPVGRVGVCGVCTGVVTTSGRGGIEIEGGGFIEGLEVESDAIFCAFWAVCEVTAQSGSVVREAPVEVVSPELAVSSPFSFNLSAPSACALLILDILILLARCLVCVNSTSSALGVMVG